MARRRTAGDEEATAVPPPAAWAHAIVTRLVEDRRSGALRTRLDPRGTARDKDMMSSKPVERLAVPSAGPSRVRTICVYCGSSARFDPVYEPAAVGLGRAMAKAGIGLVYGGGSNGIMGLVARAVLAGNGHVTGIIPDFLIDKNDGLDGIQECIVVPDMHTRKRLMFERSDAFVALPGGIGTLEELVEQLTWVQLGRHSKPVVIADVKGFWQPLLELFAHMRQNGFIASEFEVRYLVAEKIDDILPMIETAMARLERREARQETLDSRL
jgi:uncharacterized protein (TIGR00730 family)